MNADQQFNEDLFNHFSSKDDEFWRIWRKRNCSGQVFRIGTVDVLRACDACTDMSTAYSV